MGVFSKMAATSTSGRGNPSRSSKKREMPYQDFTRIKSNVLGKRQGKQGEIQSQDLYSDPSFPPDQSSLTYVYSGDDKYEKMVFRRPKQICPDAVLIGVGGACVTDFPSHSWRQKTWFRAALVIASLSVKYMERLVPGYRSLDQTFDHDYVGAFRFNLWRFGEWIEAVVDDFLPVLCNELAFCPSLGSPPEFWAPLVEKAYAKCCKTYEAIEVGKSIDALTDLTGAVCEYFTPDVNPPENLFHTLYKSSVNRSFMVCWRNDKRLTHTGFHYDQQKTGRNEDGPEKARKYLHIITATTKFPMTDGRLIEMVRLKCVFPQEPTWNGKFCNRDVISWKSLNLDFAERYKPFTYKDEDEFWITLEDFQCNFGGLVICSGPEPFRCQGFNVERKYAAGKHLLGKNISNSLPNSGRKGNRSDRNSAERVFAESCPFASSPIGRHDTHVGGRTNHSGGESFDIRVKETQNTIKIDNSDFTTDDSSSSGSGATSFTTKYVKKGSLRKHIHKSKRKLSHQEMVSSRKFSTGRRDKSDDSEGNGTDIGIERKFGGDDTYSTSDIYITVQASQSRENSDGRPRSAPVALPITRAQSTGSLSSLTQSTFLATRADHFRSHGSWDEMLHFKGYWQRKTGTNRLVVDSKNFGQRALLTVSKADAVNENIGPDFEGRSHVLVSLMQDYRRGSSISGILMAHIGFGVYKTKNPDKDEKRSLSKLAMVVRQDSRGDAREVSLRLDLLPGNYFIVPYCSDQDHEGEFLLRVLGEKDSIAAKTGCLVS